MKKKLQAGKTPPKSTIERASAVGIPELLDHARHWLDKAVEHYDDEDYEAVDAACRIAQVHADLADTAIEREHLNLAKERHLYEVGKRIKAMETMEQAAAQIEEGVNKRWPSSGGAL